MVAAARTAHAVAVAVANRQLRTSDGVRGPAAPVDAPRPERIEDPHRASLHNAGAGEGEIRAAAAGSRRLARPAAEASVFCPAPMGGESSAPTRTNRAAIAPRSPNWQQQC